MSIIRADSIKNRAGTGAPDFPNGITVTGIVTSTVLDASVTNLTVTGNLGVGGTVTYEDVSNVDSVGVITCLLYTSPSPRDLSTSRMPSSA